MASGPTGTPDVPPAVRALVDHWRQRGSPAQKPMSWPRGRWLDAFGGDREFLQSLPGELDRDAVRSACSGTRRDEDGAREAFLAAMCWGYGATGYGPFRSARVLQDEAAPAKLATARALTAAEGPIAAYRFLATDGRIPGLGPAFGTKYLYFTDESRAGALILDRITAGAFQDATGTDLHPTRWDTPSYGYYVAMMSVWAESLGIIPEHLEQVMFVDAATRLGNQWSE